MAHYNLREKGSVWVSTITYQIWVLWGCSKPENVSRKPNLYFFTSPFQINKIQVLILCDQNQNLYFNKIPKQLAHTLKFEKHDSTAFQKDPGRPGAWHLLQESERRVCHRTWLNVIRSSWPVVRAGEKCCKILLNSAAIHKISLKCLESSKFEVFR